MNLSFRSRPHASEATPVGTLLVPPRHRVESGFSVGRCRFTLDCTCGAHHDTPFIDEALTWREQHQRQA